MIRIMKYGEVPNSEIFDRSMPTANAAETVAEILRNVREKGDEALLYYTEKFDRAKLTSLTVTPEEMQEALDNTDPEFLRILEEAAARGHRSAAVVCRTVQQAENAEEALRAARPEFFAEEAPCQVMVLPLEKVKGLEFDVVILWEPTDRNYPEDVKNAKLLYVAITRALHELHLLTSGKLTGLINS